MHTAKEIQDEHKRHFFIFCTWLMIGTMIFMSFLDLHEGEINEFISDLLTLAALFGGYAAIRLKKKEGIIYRVVISLIILNLYYSVYIGSGQETVLFWTFFMPPLFFYFFEKREGIIWGMAFFASLAIIMLFPSFLGSHHYKPVTLSRFMITFPIVTIVCFGLESSRDLFSRMLDSRNRQLIKEKEQLEQAINEIQTLSGLVPICASCKNIRNDDGYWERVETYIEARSAVDFTHGLCPDCLKRLYPNLKMKKEGKKERTPPQPARGK